jgi:3-vinyl bacteriochlorophyllide hydratase
MNAIRTVRGREISEDDGDHRRIGTPSSSRTPKSRPRFSFTALWDDAIDAIGPSPWGAHSGRNTLQRGYAPISIKAPLYTEEERKRRDASGWTIVQGVLAPLQFVAFAVSLGLILRYLVTGHGYAIATGSILVKTIALYAIMITGSIWEKEVFGRWLFARPFFWEDVFSMLVLALQTTYLGALLTGWGSAREQMLIAVAAYAAYVINAAQFLLKLRAARLDARQGHAAEHGRLEHAT